MTAADLYEWAVYLNSPFSERGREVMTNAWLVHTIRSIVAAKNRRPKFSDAVFPFDKMCRGYFDKAGGKKTGKHAMAVGKAARDGKPKNEGEVAHMAQVIRQRYERKMADYRAGRETNAYGMYIHERLR